MTTQEFYAEIRALYASRERGDLTDTELAVELARLERIYRDEYVSPAEY